jgi:hypothetical protein
VLMVVTLSFVTLSFSKGRRVEGQHPYLKSWFESLTLSYTDASQGVSTINHYTINH